MTETNLITQNRFWPFFVILSGFLGVPRTIYFGYLSLYFDYFFARKTVGSRETPRDGLLLLLLLNALNIKIKLAPLRRKVPYVQHYKIYFAKTFIVVDIYPTLHNFAVKCNKILGVCVNK